MLTALQNPPLRDAAATVVTGVGAFAWVKLFNWFASKQVFDQVCSRLNHRVDTVATRVCFRDITVATLLCMTITCKSALL